MIPSFEFFCNRTRLVAALPFVLCGLLAGCGGGSSSASVAQGAGAGPTPAPGPTASASPPSYVVHVIIDASGSQSITTLPAGAANPPGVNVGAVVPGAIVTYPDGSQQVADLNGVVVPAASSYGVANSLALETNLEAAPFVTVSDPSGTARAITTQVDAANANSTAVSSNSISPQNVYAHILDGPAQINLAQIQIHPSFINAVAGESVPLEIVGIDNAGHATSLTGTTIFWAPPQQGGTITPIPGTNRAIFRAPASGSAVVGSGASVSATNGTTTQIYSAAYNVAYIDAASNTSVSGKISAAPGAAAIVPGSFVEFVQRSGIPSGVHPFVWYAQVDASGSYSRPLPKSVSFTPVIGLKTSNGVLIEGLNTSTGGSTYSSGAAGSTASVPLTLSSNPTIFLDNSTGYRPLPPISSYIRDAWFSSSIPLARHIFDSDSGLQPILASASVSASGTINDGLFKYWKYQWSGTSAAPVLTIVEVYSNGTAGRQTATISPGAAGIYSYIRYYAPNAPVSTAAPLVANQPGMLLSSDGSWTQNAPASLTAAASNFSAIIKINTYNSSHQVLGAPVYIENLTYSRNSTGAVQLANDNFTDAKGTLLWTFNGGRSGFNSAAYGTTNPVYSYSGSLARVYHTSTGDARATFNLAGIFNGDGSGNVSYTNGTTGTQVVYALLPQTATSTTRANNGVVATPGQGTQATFTVSTANQVTATITPDPANNFPGTQIIFGL